MKLSQAAARVVVPDGLPAAEAVARTTHLGVGAHPDDLEIMAWHGIAACLGRSDRWFSGVVVTDGASSPRAGRYAACSDDEMRRIRLAEQSKAAAIGEYAALIYLGHASAATRAPGPPDLLADLAEALRAARPETVFTHNLCDAHDTHVAVALHVIAAIRGLPADERPRALYGCEVWRSLDWLGEADRRVFDAGGGEHLAAAALGVYDSQIAGGKRYDLATLGRRRANATYGDARSVDRSEAAELAMDLTPLIRDPALDIVDYALAMVRRFSDDVSARLRRLLP